MKRLLLALVSIGGGVLSVAGQGAVSIPPIYVAGYAREFLMSVDNGLYYGALYGAVSNSPSPTLAPLYPNSIITENWHATPVAGSHLTFPNPLVLGYPSGTQMFLQAQVWVGSLGPGWTHYNSPLVLVTLDGANPPIVNFGTLVVPLIPEPTSPVLVGSGCLLVLRRLLARKLSR